MIGIGKRQCSPIAKNAHRLVERYTALLQIACGFLIVPLKFEHAKHLKGLTSALWRGVRPSWARTYGVKVPLWEYQLELILTTRIKTTWLPEWASPLRSRLRGPYSKRAMLGRMREVFICGEERQIVPDGELCKQCINGADLNA